MDLTKLLAQLRVELANLDAAILSLERLQQVSPRRGRPPKSAAKNKRAAAGGDKPSSDTDDANE